MEEWSIYNAGDNNKQANLLISQDSVFFYKQLDRGMVCPSLFISSGDHDYCIYRSMALSGFLKEYQFNQIGKRLEHKVTVEIELTDKGHPKKAENKCYDLLESKGSFTYKILLNGIVYYSRATAIEVTHIGFKNERMTYADFKKKIIKEIKKDRSLFWNYWIAPKGKTEYIYFELGYDVNYRIDCKIVSEGIINMLIMSSASSDEHHIVLQKD